MMIGDNSILDRRHDFVEAFPCLSQDAVTAISQGHKLKPVDLICLQYAGQKLYPAFQFDSGGDILPSVKTILKKSVGRRTHWDIVLWLTRPLANSGRIVDRISDVEWIEDCLSQELDRVIGRR